MSDRTIDCFFYGLFMDPDVLERSGVAPRKPRSAHVDHFELVIGDRATLWPCEGMRAYGMVYSMTHTELEKLYSGTGLKIYKPEALETVSLDNSLPVACLCYNLPVRPSEDVFNKDYLEQLKSALDRLGFPKQYINSLP